MNPPTATATAIAMENGSVLRQEEPDTYWYVGTTYVEEKTAAGWARARARGGERGERPATEGVFATPPTGTGITVKHNS